MSRGPGDGDRPSRDGILILRRLGDIRHAQLGAFLALLIVAFSPNYGIEKYGPSPAVPAFLLCLMGLWLLWRERVALFDAPAMRRWPLMFLLLYVPVLISVPGSLEPRTSLTIAAVLPLYFFAGLALVRALRETVQREWLARWVAVLLLFWAADGAIQYLFGVDLFGVPIGPQDRVLGPFANNTRLPLMLALFAPLMLAAFLPERPRLAWLAFAFVAVVAILNGTRTMLPWLAVVAVALFLRLPKSRWRWAALLALVAGAVTVVALSPALVAKLGMLRYVDSLGFETFDRLLSFRLTIWDTAVNMLMDRPWTGVGAGAFDSAYNEYALRSADFFRDLGLSPYHAHHLYFGVAAESGLPGLAALTAMAVLGVRWYFALPREARRPAWPYAVAMLIYAFPVNSQPVPFTHWMFPVLLLLLAGMLAALDPPRTETGPTPRV